MSAAFTPGPWSLSSWRVGARQDHRAIWGPQAPGYPHGVLCHTMGRRPREINDANACLITAAPELLETLECALDEYEQHNGRKLDGPHWSVAARALIDKAKGV